MTCMKLLTCRFVPFQRKQCEKVGARHADATGEPRPADERSTAEQRQRRGVEGPAGDLQGRKQSHESKGLSLYLTGLTTHSEEK